jgi:hypothetical protein
LDGILGVPDNLVACTALISRARVAEPFSRACGARQFFARLPLSGFGGMPLLNCFFIPSSVSVGATSRTDPDQCAAAKTLRGN